MEVKKIFFDMDGVLADFNRGVEELCNLPRVEQSKADKARDDEMWARIRQIEHFYDKLEPMDGAVEMFKAIYEKYGDKCEILTGIPKPKRGILNAGEDKTAWIHRLFSPDIKVNIVFKEEKKNYCTGKDCILIDDLISNINDWESTGGTGILFKSPEDVKVLL